MEILYLIYNDWGELYKVCFSKDRVNLHLSIQVNPQSFTVDIIRVTKEQAKSYIQKLKKRNGNIIDTYMNQK